MSENVDFVEAPDLRELAAALLERYFDYLPKVDVESIYFAQRGGTKPKKAKTIEISGVATAWVKVLLASQQRDERYCISIWDEDWAQLGPSTQQWLMFNELMKIGPKVDGSIRKPDVVGWGFIQEYMVQTGLGAYWEKKLGVAPMPDLLQEDGSTLPIPLPPNEEDTEDSTI